MTVMLTILLQEYHHQGKGLFINTDTRGKRLDRPDIYQPVHHFPGFQRAGWMQLNSVLEKVKLCGLGWCCSAYILFANPQYQSG